MIIANWSFVNFSVEIILITRNILTISLSCTGYLGAQMPENVFISSMLSGDFFFNQNQLSFPGLLQGEAYCSSILFINT